MKNIIKIKDITFIVIILILFMIVVSPFVPNTNPVRVVISRSMEPTLHRGDIVFIVPCKIESINVGDIIAFYSKLQKDLVIHRVVEKRVIGNRIMLITKGDNNVKTDQEYGEDMVCEKNFVGKALYIGGRIFKIPAVGYVAYMLRRAGTPYSIDKRDLWYTVILGSIIFMFFISFVDISRKHKNKIVMLYKYERIGFFTTILIFFISFSIIFSTLHITVAYSQRTITSSSEVIYVYNPTAIPMKGFVLLENNSDRDVIYFDISPEELKILKNEDRRIGLVTVYSSIFWIIFPENVLAYLGSTGKIGVILLDILSAIFFSTVISVGFLLIDLSVDLYHYFISRRSYRKGQAPIRKYLSYRRDAIVFSILSGTLLGSFLVIFSLAIFVMFVFLIMFRIHPYIFSIFAAFSFTSIILYTNKVVIENSLLHFLLLTISLFSMTYIFSLILSRLISEVIFRESV